MAQRRMFNVSIMTSDAFLDLLPRDQILYVQLCLHADDDGVVEASKVLRMIKARTDSVSRLCHQRITSVLRASPLLIHITHWLDHNLIRPDRKVDSKYKDLLLQTIDNIKLTEATQRKDRIKKEIEYECLGRPMDDEWTQYGQYSVGVGKDLTYEQDPNSMPSPTFGAFLEENQEVVHKKEKPKETYTQEFEETWAHYPKRSGSESKADAFRCWQKRVKQKVLAEHLLSATKNYKLYCEKSGSINTPYVMRASRFYGEKKEYEKFISIDVNNEVTSETCQRTNKPITATEHNRNISNKLLEMYRACEAEENNT